MLHTDAVVSYQSTWKYIKVITILYILPYMLHIIKSDIRDKCTLILPTLL